MKLIAKPEQIIDVCQRNGIEVSLVSHRFRFKHCPTCGTAKWKLWLYDKTYAGSCFRCHTPYNLFSLFKAFGASIKDLLAFSPENIVVEGAAFSLVEDEEVETKIIPSAINLPRNRFFRICEWPTHPASKYALSRGVPKELFDVILIDIQTNAVCFLICDDSDTAIGYQLRYVNPVNPDVKTWTMEDFKVGEHVLMYSRPDGDLIVCEGPFNAVTAFNWGHTGLCTFGSRITTVQIDKLCALAQSRQKPLSCAFDMDDAGWHAYLQVKELCSGRGIEVIKIEPEIGNDLNDAWKVDMKYRKSNPPASSLLQYLPDL